MKLELKHLAPYLPYGLKCKEHGKMVTLEILYYDKEGEYDFKPILRPLSDLTKEIEHNGEKFVPTERMQLFKDVQTLHYTHWGVHDYMLMLELHFDVFGLIDEGLAIDINNLKEA